jgi:hypothetical protein
MSTADTLKGARSSGYRILALAILFSLFWHLFWLSAIKVVAAPVKTLQVRPSKVLFLGPILAKVGLEVRAQPASISFLERRYLAAASRSGRAVEAGLQARGEKYRQGPGAPSGSDDGMVRLVGEAVSGAKVEPDYPSE